MTSQSQLKYRSESFISALAAEFGVGHTPVNGAFNITIDHIHLEIKSRANLVVLYSNIHQVPAEDALAVFKSLLSLSWNKNTHFDEGLSIDKASNSLYLSKKIDTQSLPNRDFLLSVETFLNTAEYFAQACEKFDTTQERNHYQLNTSYSKPHHSMNKET